MKFFKIIITSAVGFAVLIAIAACGVFFLKNTVDSQLNPPKSELKQRAEKIADFSKIPKTYTVTKAINIVGINAVVAEHPKTGQYMGIVDPGWSMDISKKDIYTGKLTQKLTEYALKVSSPSLKLDKLEVAPKGNLNIFDQSVPYADIKVKIASSSGETTYEGMVGIVEKPGTKKTELIVSLNRDGAYKQKIAENFFKNVKLQ